MKNLLIAKNSQGKIELVLCEANLWRYKVTYTNQDPFYTADHYKEDQRLLAIQKMSEIAAYTLDKYFPELCNKLYK